MRSPKQIKDEWWEELRLYVQWTPELVSRIEDTLSYIEQLEAELDAVRLSFARQSREVEEWRLEALKKLLQIANTALYWIPTEERLPEPHTGVLVHVTNNSGWECIETDMHDGSKWLGNCDEEQHHVTHWMPLPNWPKEEKDDV